MSLTPLPIIREFLLPDAATRQHFQALMRLSNLRPARPKENVGYWLLIRSPDTLFARVYDGSTDHWLISLLIANGFQYNLPPYAPYTCCEEKTA
jgi:hypothetical protein